MWHSLGSWRVGKGGERWRWDLILPEAGDFLLARPGRVWDGRRARTRVRAFPGGWERASEFCNPPSPPDPVPLTFLGGAIARFLTWFSVEAGGPQSVVPGPVAAASPGNLLEVHILPAESYTVGRAQHHCVLTNPQGVPMHSGVRPAALASKLCGAGMGPVCPGRQSVLTVNGRPSVRIAAREGEELGRVCLLGGPCPHRGLCQPQLPSATSLSHTHTEARPLMDSDHPGSKRLRVPEASSP